MLKLESLDGSLIIEGLALANDVLGTGPLAGEPELPSDLSDILSGLRWRPIEAGLTRRIFKVFDLALGSGFGLGGGLVSSRRSKAAL